MICTIKYFIFILFEATKSGAKFMQQTFTVQFIFQPHCGTDAIKNEASINILFNPNIYSLCSNKIWNIKNLQAYAANFQCPLGVIWTLDHLVLQPLAVHSLRQGSNLACS